MKNYIALVKKFPESSYFIIFNILFYSAMALSRSIHSLYFEEHHSLSNYGISYSAMAFAGIFGAFIGEKVSSYNSRNVIKLGVCIYFLGMFLRIFYNNYWIAMISGFTAGIGASVVIILLKVWVIGIGGKKERATVVSLKGFSSSLGGALGALLSGILVYFLSQYLNNFLEVILIMASLLCLISIKFIPEIDFNNDISQEKEMKINKLGKGRLSLLNVGVSFFGIFSGLLSSLFAPYLPVILKYQGVSISHVGLILTFLGIIGAYFSSIFSNKKLDKHKKYLYIVSEIGLAILTVLFIYKLNIYLILIVLVFRTFVSYLSNIVQELIELDMYPRGELSRLYGLAQSMYFIGDSIGGLLSGYLYNTNINISIILFSILVIVNAYLFSKFSQIILESKD